MGIKYVVGRAGAGKTDYIYEEIRENLNRNNQQKLILIVPEQFTLQAERDLIEKLQLPGIINIEVLSFTRLAHNVLNQIGGITRIHINQQGKDVIIRKIIEEAKDKLTIYKNAAKQAGFIAIFSELLTELKQHNVTPDDLQRELATIPESSILQNKIQDIALIYQQFNDYLQGKYLDSEDYINLLIERMEQADFLKGAKIWIDGFHSHTPQTYQIIDKLSIMSEEITFTLTADFAGENQTDDLFKLSELNYQKLQAIAKSYNQPEKLINLNGGQQQDFNKATEIAHLERELYSYPYRVFTEPVSNIEVFAGQNLHTEIENAAAKIVALVRDHGYRFKDIAVVSNGLENYSAIIKNTFEVYNIPYFLDEKKSVMHNPIIELVLSVLMIIERGFQYEDVFKYLKTGFVKLSLDEVEKLENYALQYGIRGKRWHEEFTLGDLNSLAKLNKSRNTIIEPLRKLEKQLKGKRSIEQIAIALYDFLQAGQIDEQLDSWIEELRAKGQYTYVAENSQIWNLLIEIFDQLVELLGEQVINLKEFSRILEAGFNSAKIGIIPTTVDQVLVGNIHRSRSHEIKALFVVGVNDGILPAGKDYENILSDEEKSFFSQRGFNIGMDSRIKGYEEKLMIYSAFSKPTDYLWLSYALADEEGKALRPSLLLDRFKKVFRQIEIKTDIIMDEARERQLISTPNSTIKHLAASLRQHLDGLPIEEHWLTVYRWYQENKDWDSLRASLDGGLFHQNQAADIGKSSAKRLYRTPIRSSVSRLEQFVNCPFAHFVRYGLRPKERKVYEIKAPDIGDIFHKALELFPLKLQEQKLDWRETGIEQAKQLIASVIDELIPAYGNGVMFSTNRYKYLTTRLKRISQRAITVLTEQLKRGGFNPLGHEIGFGSNLLFPPIELELADGEMIYLEGRIDRVDILDDAEQSYIKIIDYKSGYKNFNISEVFHGLQLQLMIYLKAILNNRQILGSNQLKPAGVFYFKIDDPLVKNHQKDQAEIEKIILKELKMKGLALKDVKIVREIDRHIDGYSEIIPAAIKKDETFYKDSSVADQQEFLALIDHAERLAKEISEEILKGKIRIEPSKNGNRLYCEFCQYRAICQFDQGFTDNHYRNIPKLNNEEVIERILNS